MVVNPGSGRSCHNRTPPCFLPELGNRAVYLQPVLKSLFHQRAQTDKSRFQIPIMIFHDDIRSEPVRLTSGRLNS
jgi:hypothetical protein